MKKNLILWVLTVATWIISPMEIQAKQKANPVFEHVHALVMDADGRYLLLGAHTGLFRSDDSGVTWRKSLLPGRTTASSGQEADQPLPTIQIRHGGFRRGGVSLQTGNKRQGKTQKEFEAKGYRARNSRDLWFCKELESLKRDLGLQR